ncbi:hypothetical protein D3C76_457430 [compost metagenome]
MVRTGLIIGPIKCGEEHPELQRFFRIFWQVPGWHQLLEPLRYVVLSQQEIDYDL